MSLQRLLAPLALGLAACATGSSLQLVDIGDGLYARSPEVVPSCGALADDQVSGTAPLLLNSRAIELALAREYRSDMREQGISGTTRTWACIGEDGSVEAVSSDGTSGHLRLDLAARKVVIAMQFARPAEGPEWVSLSFNFSRQTGPGLGEEIRRGG